MAEKIVITDLEFESIKTNLKAFLQTQQTFLDYNFEGSALSILINLLALNTYYNSYYTNMLANESFTDSAQIRNSLLSHAKKLNYTPVSRRAATAIVNVLVTPPGGNTQAILTIDRFTEFQSQSIDGVNYTFVIPEAISIKKENGAFPFNGIDIKAGTPQVVTFTYDPSTNPASRFELPNDDIDTSTLQVVVQASISNTSSRVYTLSTDITQANSSSEIYYLSPSTNDRYQITFGDGRVSRSLSNGNIVVTSYLSTAGANANKANSFATGSIGGFSNVIITPVSSASGGAERETNDSIRVSAPLSYTSQGRAVTRKDYETLLKSLYPDIQSIFVWGGEDNIPPVYGKVFISIAPKEGVVINDAEKVRIATDILAPITMVTVTPELVDPDYVYMQFESRVDVDGKLTVLTSDQIAESVRQAITDYCTATLNQFGATFVGSKLGRAIDDSVSAIIGSDSTVRLEKRFIPTMNVSSTYAVNFNTALHRAPIQKGIKTTAFGVYDGTNVLRTSYIEEVFNSSTGVDSIDITNAGYNYTEAPTVTITGDGTGAAAVATIVNGRVDTITVTKRGTGYTSALATLTGGGGQAATASPVVQAKFGTLRLYYFNSNSEKVDINPSIGTIDYTNGQISISALKVATVPDSGDIRMNAEPDSMIVETQQNQLLLLDTTDTGAIIVTVEIR